jgi:hypothetical protein
MRGFAAEKFLRRNRTKGLGLVTISSDSHLLNGSTWVTLRDQR